jgi:polyferredoxin
MGLFAWSFTTRVALGLDVIRDRNQLYRETNEGLIENVYILKILNMDAASHRFNLKVSGISGMKMYLDVPEIRVQSGDILELPVRLRVDEDELKARSTQIIFDLAADDNPALSATEAARFLGPH